MMKKIDAMLDAHNKSLNKEVMIFCIYIMVDFTTFICQQGDFLPEKATDSVNVGEELTKFIDEVLYENVPV